MKILALHDRRGMLLHLHAVLVREGHQVECLGIISGCEPPPWGSDQFKSSKESEGQIWECVEDPEQALSLYRHKGPFDVILSNPIGADFLRAVPKENPLQEMILVSASPRKVLLPLISELKLPLLEVPFRSWELVEAVESHKHRSVQ